MTDKVRYETADAVATITIARPEVRNAMDRDVFGLLFDLGRRAWMDDDVRAIVVAGEGQAFSSGIDTTIFTNPDATGAAFDPIGVDVSFFQRAFTVYEEMPKPVVAAVHGPAFGAGCQLALACDLRVVGADVSFSIMETKWGIIPDLGGTQRLPRIVGLGRAKEMALTARRIGSEEALAWGLANRVAPAGEHLKVARELATELAAGPPLALAAIKRLAGSAFETPVRTGLEREAMIQRRILASEDAIEAVSARVGKRAPTFRAR